MASHRPDRVAEQIRDELSTLLSRGAVHDPGIGFITLTRVKVSRDLQMARVFYTSLGDDRARKETAKALARATPFLRRQIGRVLGLRRVPELNFRFDESIEQARKQNDLQPGSGQVNLGMAYAAKGMYQEAVAELEKLPQNIA